MKILILGFTKIKYMPYMSFYLDQLDIKKHDIHILYWNRDLKHESKTELNGYTFHEFECYQEDDVPKTSKIPSFIKYRQYAKKIITRENFSFIFVLHSLPGVLIADILKKKYKNRYILDYRDSTYESFTWFKKIIGDLVKGSCVTFVSSDAFRQLLPESENSKIHTSHNLLWESLSHRDEKEKYGESSDKIRIAFWGFIRHEEVNRELIAKIAADKRFELHYYGREQQVAINLKKYAVEIAAGNVFFHGEYKPQDRYVFVRRTDLIHNIYNDHNMMLAMGNKYYDAAIFRIPLLSIRGSFMAINAEKANIGLSVDPYDDDFTDQLYSYYQNLDKCVFYQSCNRELDRILKEYDEGAKLIKCLTDSEGNV